ncbi:hypothetical protein [Chryseobacterium sp. GP-SGM7]|uniref:hypothetical protein n=1 Tax=Chryseobacterium sp. GP-SGM7 TaxID=3411323 RepID=UPI003B93034D
MSNFLGAVHLRGFFIYLPHDIIVRERGFLLYQSRITNPRHRVGKSARSGPAMLNRFNDIEKLDPENKKHLLSVVDGFIQALKIKNIAAL